MNELDEYQSQALQTAVYPLARALDYTVLGLVSEVGELAEVYADANYDAGAGFGWPQTYVDDALSEIGDGFWYCAAIADAMGTTLGVITATSTRSTVHLSASRGLIMIALTKEAGAIAGIAKKAIRDNGGVLTAAKQREIEAHLLNVLALLEHFAVKLGSSRKGVMNKNLAKLSDRKARGTLQGSGNER